MTSGHLRAMIALFLGRASRASTVALVGGIEADGVIVPALAIIEPDANDFACWIEAEKRFLLELHAHYVPTDQLACL